MWRKWYRGQRARWEPHGSRETIGAVSRAPTLAIKFALALSLDFGTAGTGDYWHVTAPVLRIAMVLADWHLRSVFAVSHFLCATPYQRNRRKVLCAIRPVGTPFGVIAAKSRLSPRLLKEALTGLLAERPKVIWRWGAVTGTNSNEGENTFYSTSPFMDVNDPDNVVQFPTGGGPGIGTPSSSQESQGSGVEATAVGNGGLPSLMPSPEALAAGAEVPDVED